jgi:alkaline phosphatase D
MTQKAPHRRSILKRAAWFAASLPFAPEVWAQTLGYPRTLQGPMVGAPTPNSIRVWARVSGTFDVVLEVSARRDFAELRASQPVRADASSDFTAVVSVDGLSPATTNYYRQRNDCPTAHGLRRAAAAHSALRSARARACRLTRTNAFSAWPRRSNRT